MIKKPATPLKSAYLHSINATDFTCVVIEKRY